MNRIRWFLCCAILLTAIAGYQQIVGAVSPRVLITETVSDTKLVTLAGNMRPEANAHNDRGPVAEDFPLEHLWLQLRRSPEQEQALEEFIDQLTNPKSPNYHHWINANEFGQKYGLAQQDLDKIAGWLRSHGFTVNFAYPNRVLLDFSGTAGQVREAFHTELHNLEVNGEKHIANMSEPRIPAALAPAVVGVVSLNDFRPRTMLKPRPAYTFSGCGSDCNYVVPADLATIYNFNPLFAAGYSGQGQTIVAIEETDLYTTNDWSTFRNTFGLNSAYPMGSLTQAHPAPGGSETSTTCNGGSCNCADPGVVSPYDSEAILDAEWASAAAPNAEIELASCANTATNLGGFIALQNLLSNGGPVPAVVSISFAVSEEDLGATLNAYINSLGQQAVAAGVSVFVAAGDFGAASSDGLFAPGLTKDAKDGINVNGYASTPYGVAVGGTDFGDTYAGTNSAYWSATNGPNYGSALSSVPEIPWNSTCASTLIANFLGFSTTYGSSSLCNNLTASDSSLLDIVAGGGGPSGCATGAPSTPGVKSGTCTGYPKPSWQSIFGNPDDGVRDLPDVSLFASAGTWRHSYVICYSNIANGGTSCSGAPDTWSFFGGTSFAAPIMAAIQTLMNQRTGARQGNPNPLYYSLAAAEYGSTGDLDCESDPLGSNPSSSCIFYDIVRGDTVIPCTGGNNCYSPSGTYGVLSTSDSAYQPAYSAGPGWDFATGIGSVNAYNLVMAAPTATASPTSTAPTPTPNTTATATRTATPTATQTATASPTPIAEKLTISPNSLAFGDKTTVGKTSKAKTVTIKNDGSKKTGLAASIEMENASPSVFAVKSECETTLAPGMSCKVSVTFEPMDTTPQTGSLMIFDNVTGAPQSVGLSGTGKVLKMKK